MRKSGIALVFLGLFLLTGAALAPTYVYNALAVMPANADITVVATSSDGKPATYFDLSTLKEVSAPLKSITVVHGDPDAAADAGEDVDVWDAYACTGPATTTCTSESLPLSGSRTLLALDAHTGQTVAWDGAYVESGGHRDDDPGIDGYVYKLPFNVAKRTYAWWNGDLGATADLRYTGTATIQGLDVYRFTQTIPPTKTGTIDLPGALAGSPQPTVTGDQMVSSVLDVTVEPETGVAITRTLSIDNYVAVGGRRVLTTTRGTFEVDERTVTDTVDEYQPLATELYLLRRGIPIGAGIAGLLATATGILLLTRAHPPTDRRTTRDVPSQPKKATR